MGGLKFPGLMCKNDQMRGNISNKHSKDSATHHLGSPISAPFVMSPCPGGHPAGFFSLRNLGPGDYASRVRGSSFSVLRERIEPPLVDLPTPEALRQPVKSANVALFVGGGGNLGYIRPIVLNSSLITSKVPNR